MLTALAGTLRAQVEMEILRGSRLAAMPGMVYLHEVDFYGSQYAFLVQVQKVGKDGGRTFKYTVSNNGKTGAVFIPTAAMNSAIAPYNMFSVANKTPDNMTSVWVSKKVYNGLVSTGKATISAGSGKTKTTLEVQAVEDMITKPSMPSAAKPYPPRAISGRPMPVTRISI